MRPPRIQTMVHLAVLQKFVYRLGSDLLDDETRARPESCVKTYQRIYVHG